MKPASSCQCLLQSSLERAPGLGLGQRRRQGLASGTYPSCCMVGWRLLFNSRTGLRHPCPLTGGRLRCCSSSLCSCAAHFSGSIYMLRTAIVSHFPFSFVHKSGASMGMRSFGFVSLGSRRCCGGAPAIH